MMQHNWPHLYANSLVDVSDLAEWQGKDQGGFYAQSEAYIKVGSKWLALPHGIVPGCRSPTASRGSRRSAQTTWPKTLEELRQVGMKLKKKGHPIGQTLAHTFGDAPAWSYPLCGTSVAPRPTRAARRPSTPRRRSSPSSSCRPSGRTPATRAALAWDDTNNNRAFLAGEIVATLNGASIYIAAKRGQDKIKDDRGEPMVRDIEHGPMPAGPAGASAYHAAFAHGGHEVQQEPEAGQGLPQVARQQGAIRQAGSRWPRASRSGRPSSGSRARCGATIDAPMKSYRRRPRTTRA